MMINLFTQNHIVCSLFLHNWINMTPYNKPKKLKNHENKNNPFYCNVYDDDGSLCPGAFNYAHI
jgi:hypothetical protein